MPKKQQKTGRPLTYKTDAELSAAIEDYFAECQEQDRPYTISGLAYHLNISRRTVVNYANNDLFFLTIKRARERCEQYAEEQLYRQKGSTKGIQFSMKNNYNWHDKQELDTTHKVDVEGLKTLLIGLPEALRGGIQDTLLPDSQDLLTDGGDE